jgi:hypothetical protein
MMRIILALLFVAHGIAHLPGFLVPWKIGHSADVPYSPTVLNGAVDLGPVAMRALSTLWVIAALGFVVAGIATVRGDPGWSTLALGVTTFSLVLTFLGCPLSRIGAALNLLLLAILLLGPSLGWSPSGA